MLLAESVDSYRAALTVYTETAHPLDWATTKQNLGAALSNYGSRIAGLRGIELFGEAAEAYREAMRVRTEIDQPLQWAMTQENLAVLEECWSEHAACNDRLSHLNAALLHVEAALTAYNPEHMSYGLKKASDLRDRLLAAIAALS